MIITKEWLNEFIDVSHVSTEKLTNTLNSIGHEVASVKEIVLDENIVVGFVTSCQKHPNADKLSVCQVDVGKESVQIVCGAKNVREGLFVPVSKVGATLPGGLKIKNAQLRDIESFGMICSAKELGLPDINDGILELDKSIGDLVIGKAMQEYPILADSVIEVELTANRGDCLSINGISRDLTASLKLNGRNIDKRLDDEKSLGIGRAVSISSSSNVTSKNMFRIAKNCDFKISLKHQLRLGFIEESYSTDIEALVKYASHATGVLLNAFKCAGLENEDKKINIEIKKNGFIDSVYIDGKEVVQSGVKVIKSELADEKSKEVVFEATYVNPNEISEVVFEKNLETDDSFYRSSRGSEPDLQLGMSTLLKEIETFSNIYFYSETVQNKIDFDTKTIHINLDNVSAKIGQKIDKNKIVEILKLLNFSVQVSPEQNNLIVRVPLFRHDITNEADVIEEFVRIIGIDNIDSKPILIAEKKNNNEIYKQYKQERVLATASASAGFSESLHFVFASKKKLKSFGFDIVDEKLDVLNPITSDLDTLRTSLIPNLLEAVKLNINKSKSKVSLFEIGDTFNKDRAQFRTLALISSGDKEKDSVLNSGKPEKESFGSFVEKISQVLPSFSLEKTKIAKEIFHPGQCADVIIDGESIGIISRINPKFEKEYGLETTFACEIDINALGTKSFLASQHSKFQPVKRDFSIVIDKEITFATIKEAIESLEIEFLQRVYPVDVYEDEKLGDNFSLTFRVTMQSLEDTLSEKQINESSEKILSALEEKFKANLR